MKDTKENKYWLGKLNYEKEKAIIPYEFDLEGSFTEESYSFQIPNEQYKLLQQLTSNDTLRLQIVLLSTIGILLHKYSGLELIRFGTPLDSQEDKAKKGGVIPLELSLESKKTFRMLLNETKDVLVEGIFHQDYDIEKLIQKFNVTDNHNPLYDVVCSISGIQEEVLATEETNNFSIIFAPEAHALNVKVSYNISRYSKVFIKDIIENFTKILAIVLGDIDISIEDIKLFPDQLNVEEHAGIKRLIDKTWIANFEEKVKATPDKIAIVDGNNELTYKELNELSNKLAYYLNENVSKESSSFVALLLENSMHTFIGIIGILKAGFAFLPLDPSIPIKRIEHILEDANPSLVLVDDNWITLNVATNIRHFNLKKLSVLEGYEHSNLNVEIALNDPAYMIYTSGTSGTPKGVIIKHESLANYTNWAANYYTDNGERSANFPLFSSISFDLTITSIFVPLLASGTVVLYNSSIAEQLFDSILLDNSLGIIKLTPSHLRLLIERIKNNDLNISNSKLHTFIVGGEAFTSELAEECTLHFPNIHLYNEYGPTEATVGCIVHKYEKNKDANFITIPVGNPIDNTTIHLLNDDKIPVPNGAIGEIYIGGKCLAEGYINNKTLTNNKFINLPTGKEDERFYQTGDLAKRMPDGTYIYLGRKDDQVKINGYRIELEEIEKYALKHPAVDNAVVIGHKMGNMVKVLLFLKVATATEIQNFNTYLSEFLPTYMLPHQVKIVPQIPLTSNGKTDTNKLLAFVKEEVYNQELPENDTEKQLYEIWKKHLENEAIGINDNFYTSGGDSIKSLGLMNEINKAFNIKMQVKDLYELKTIKNMAIRIIEKEATTLDNTIHTNEESIKEDIEKLKNEILSQL